ncbi:response regulator transcription factor [Streptomyces sp. NBC_00250]|uniref:response regulator transcription factor n=1 Tax=Streptomyces sp. NBC_00250 TaxID=2903641 RepID=UPI002E295F7B|nr:response regulator transcription factor [Streptomyces sp. NBC_00250]
MNTITVLVADDNPVVRAGLRSLLGDRPGFRVVAEAADGRAALRETLRTRPQVILLDVRMPPYDGLKALPHLARLARVLMLTYSREPETVEEALRMGAAGYLVHGEFTTEELVGAVRDVGEGRARFTATASEVLLRSLRATAHQGGGPIVSMSPHLEIESSRMQRNVEQCGLSAREVEVMDLIATGLNNRQIAATCFITEKTVKNHINRIFAKLHTHTRAEAIASWLGTRPTR